MKANIKTKPITVETVENVENSHINDNLSELTISNNEKDSDKSKNEIQNDIKSDIGKS